MFGWDRGCEMVSRLGRQGATDVSIERCCCTEGVVWWPTSRPCAPVQLPHCAPCLWLLLLQRTVQCWPLLGSLNLRLEQHELIDLCHRAHLLYTCRSTNRVKYLYWTQGSTVQLLDTGVNCTVTGYQGQLYSYWTHESTVQLLDTRVNCTVTGHVVVCYILQWHQLNGALRFIISNLLLVSS